MNTQGFYDFFLRAFTNEELLVFLRYGPQGKELTDALLATSIPHAQYVDRVVEALAQRNMLGAALLVRCSEIRPGWRAQLTELMETHGASSTALVEQVTGTSGVPSSVGEIPPGPGVPTSRVSRALIEAFSELAADPDLVELTINDAVRLRQSYDPAASVSRMADLPHPAQGIFKFWRAALFDACRHGPPMLAALLLTLPEQLITGAARTDRDILLIRLRDRTYRTDL